MKSTPGPTKPHHPDADDEGHGDGDDDEPVVDES